MKRFILRIFITALALFFVVNIVPGIHIEGIWTAVVVAFVLGILNAVVRPILILLTFPITIVTLGLFILVINASLFFFAASFIDGFEVSGFVSALIGSLLMSVVSSITHKIL